MNNINTKISHFYSWISEKVNIQNHLWQNLVNLVINHNPFSKIKSVKPNIPPVLSSYWSKIHFFFIDRSPLIICGFPIFGIMVARVHCLFLRCYLAYMVRLSHDRCREMIFVRFFILSEVLITLHICTKHAEASHVHFL